MRAPLATILVTAILLASSALAADSPEAVEQLIARYRAERAKPLSQQQLGAYRSMAKEIDRLQDRIDVDLRDDTVTLATAGPARSQLIQLSIDIDAATKDVARYQEIASRGWPADVSDAVYRGRVRIGMTTTQVGLAWGMPDSINETLTAAGRREQWVYPSSTVYFEGDKAVLIQRRRY